jgi:hypothetical protein
MHYESPYLDWAVTPNHEFLTYGKHGKASRLTAKVLSERVRIAIPQFGFECEGVTPAKKVIPGTPNGRSLRNREDLVIDFEDYARLLGWWVAEGSVKLEEGRFYIWQHASVNSVNSLEIKDLLSRVFGRVPMDHQQKGWRIDDRRVAEYLASEAGSDCYNKRIPRDIIQGGASVVDAFMDAYVKGDGCDGVYFKNDGRKSSNTVRKVGSVSRALMSDMQEMLMRRGQGLIVKLTQKEGREMTCPNSGKTYLGTNFYGGAVHLVRKRATVVPAKGMPRYMGAWSQVPYVGKVYCATTSTGLLVVRRNGKPCVTGNSQEQPARGAGEFAQAKRFSGLENFATLSSGAYSLMRENSTLRGAKNDNYWRDLRAGKPLPKVGVPFVWNKFRALLSGAGMATREVGKGRYRLAPFTDKDLDKEDPIDVDTGDLVNFSTMDTIKGGLFDPRIVTGDKWGRIRLPRPIINPAMEDSVRTLLGLTKQELEDVLAGRMELPPQLKNQLVKATNQP